MKRIVIFGFLLVPLTALAQLDGVDYTWEDKRDKDGILIQTSSVTGSAFKAVRGEMTVKASVRSLVALVEDMPACPKWADLCKESRVEKRVSPTEAYAYIYNDVPFPVSDRDVYTHVLWTVDETSGRVSMTSTATSGGPAETKAVRIENAVSQWHFTPAGNGSTKVENFAHIDPNGPTPAWITNMMLIDSPFKTMQRMRDLVEQGEYSDSEVPFLDGINSDR